MRQSATILQAETGVPGYDRARWTGGLPKLNYVKSAGGMSTLLQCGVDVPDAVLEADVPEGDHPVALFRIASPAQVGLRVCGRPENAAFRTGEGCLLASGTDSWWEVDQETSNGWFHVHFDPGLLRTVEGVHDLKLETVPKISDAHITMLVRFIFAIAAREEEPEPILWESLAQVLLWRLLLLTSGRDKGESSRGGLATWQIRRTTEYLAAHIDRRVTLDELAAIAHLSPFHFARAFTRSVGVPPYRYQQQLRLDKASQLLANSDMRIIDIALAVGYESPQALARAFTQTYGSSPSQWRRRHNPK